MAGDNVTYLGQRKTGGKATNDTPAAAECTEARLMEMGFVYYDRGEVVDMETHEHRKRKREEIERNGKDRI